MFKIINSPHNKYKNITWGDNVDVTKRQSVNSFIVEKFLKKFIEKSKKKKIIDNNLNPKKFKLDLPKFKKHKIKIVKLSSSKLFIITDKKSENKKKIIYQLHGGSYLTPHVNMYFKNALRYLKIHEDIMVASLDYRIAPKNLFPCALEDAIEGWKYLISKGYKENDIIIVGDSAGGNLALVLTMYLRDKEKVSPGGLILMSPWADLTDSGDSRIYNLNNDPMFGYSKLLDKVMAPDKTYVQNEKLNNKFVSPIFDDFNNFPPMLIQIGTHEVLESDAITIYEKAIKKGVDVSLSRYHNMFHCFQLFGNFLPEAKLAWSEINEFIVEHLNL